MSEMTHSNFPVMGEGGIPSSVVNMSGNRSPYTQVQPRMGAAGEGGFGVPGGPKKATEVNAEVLGPLCKPQTTLYFPNAANHNDTGRNTVLMPSRAGVSDFWAQR